MLAVFGWRPSPSACRSRPLAARIEAGDGAGQPAVQSATTAGDPPRCMGKLPNVPEQLLAHVETVLADIQPRSARRAPGWLVTVATVPSAAYYFMPEIIRSFQARYLRVRIRLIDSSVGNVIEAVSSGRADFGPLLLPKPASQYRIHPSCRRPLCGRLSARSSAGAQGRT